jgi:ParB family transcriptional regulator, chromosome partitioning protein
MSQAPKLRGSPPRGLGRGLSALLGDDEIAATVAGGAPWSAQDTQAPRTSPVSRTPYTLPIAQLRPGSAQPRTSFESLEVLADSVRQHGLLQPILVRPVHGDPNTFEIVAGERRWRAAQIAQLHDVPVVVRSLDELDSLQIALVENLQRADLSPIDEAAGYRRLISEFNQTQEEIAHTVGKSRPHVANILRLLDLPPEVQELVRQDKLTAGHARALLAFPDPAAMAGRALEEKLSVRDLERLAAGEKAKKRTRRTDPTTPPSEKTADTRALEKRIEEALGLKANLAMTGQGEGTVLTLEIRDYEQLDLVVDRLTRR